MGNNVFAEIVHVCTHSLADLRMGILHTYPPVTLFHSLLYTIKKEGQIIFEGISLFNKHVSGHILSQSTGDVCIFQGYALLVL